jgi:hypothetical protein
MNSKKEENIWQAFARILSEYPVDIFDDLPRDLAENHDKYLKEKINKNDKDKREE